MSILHPGRRLALLLAATVGLAIPAAAQTPIKFSLDWKIEGPAAPFLIAQEKGYFADEGLDVTMDTGSGSVEPINRVASGAYDMGFGDINSVIKFNDQNPDTALKSVYMVYNKPAFAIVGRKSLGVSAPKDLEGKKLGAPGARRRLCAMADLRRGERHRRLEGDDRECRLPGPRADAGVRTGRRDHRILLLVLHQPQGQRRARRRYRRHADGRLRRRPLRQHDHRLAGLRRGPSRRGQGLPQGAQQGDQGNHRRSRGGDRICHRRQRGGRQGHRTGTPEDGVRPECR